MEILQWSSIIFVIAVIAVFFGFVFVLTHQSGKVKVDAKVDDVQLIDKGKYNAKI